MAFRSYIAALIPPSFLALYLLQKYYLRTSRQLRHIDLEAKSPLFTHFSEVLAGLSTIRAFTWSRAMLRENHALLDASQRPYYLFFCVQRWLNVVLDLFIAGMAVVLVGFALYFTNATTMGAIGLAMVNIINFNQTLGDFIEMWTMLETSLDGRDAAGEIASHSLLTLPRSAIRTSLTTLPQDPVLLPGTVRENLDPGGHTPDADLISALRKMKVWEPIEARGSGGGLDTEMSATGLSAGQKQLFCLARAVLRKRSGGIVLLDEATSNFDHATDEEVRKVLDEEFGEAGVTVVEVAHRLEAIVGYDVVVVMYEGWVVEVGKPRELLGRASRFRSLWDSRGA
ncbi:P-loop containing nucleoside triphosphate hydrolase protein [Colletotrichum phormii]|uniref:P-loop containing nucleoside triphosphate hydrolase protein n=1 Tax=Colletotrichum phormii TaxID=359342 RepID=A0AAJ0A765_9PEZI|nr:P-loop containing nucleoside triphosphate hydrolase protein [Colletotrichum phormii]KAK1656272.1 P-loop containing nucleoside triphosphate hydrolase protein [Colletotrichum phormii]